jgi:hypothetical protein
MYCRPRKQIMALDRRRKGNLALSIPDSIRRPGLAYLPAMQLARAGDVQASAAKGKRRADGTDAATGKQSEGFGTTDRHVMPCRWRRPSSA